MKDKINDGSQHVFDPSENPGAHERHFIRRNGNFLFGDRQTDINEVVFEVSLGKAQKIDHEILLQFVSDFREVVTNAVALKPNEDSDVILAVKDKLDRLYAESVSVADDQNKVQISIKKLLNVVMRAVKKGAGQDPKALQEISQEELAREAHFALLDSKLVADLLDPKSPIEDKDLVPTLLGIKKDDLALVVQLFDIQQMISILKQGSLLLEKFERKSFDVSQASENHVFMEGYLKYLEQQ